MPSGKYRSRRFARKRIRLPGKKNVIHYSKRKPGRAHCSRCGAKLNGIPLGRDPVRRNLSKSKRRPNRPYAGKLCPECLKASVKKAIHAS